MKIAKHRTLRVFLIIIGLSINSALIFAQTTLSGKVVDSNTVPLVGVNVYIKGTTNGTITDNTGNFTLQVPLNSSLVISFIGYQKQEILFEGQTELLITLVEDLAKLDEVVVIGYGAQKKADLTGAVSHIDSEEISKLPLGNALQGIQGRASGVYITQNSGSPGGDISVKIRGVASVNNNEPLYVIDGFPTTNGLSGLNPSDIESIDILKDASSTAIYGTRASNGIIFITTKKGKKGEAKFNFDSYFGWQNFANKPKLLNPIQYAELYNEELENLALATEKTFKPYYYYDPQNDGVYVADEDSVPISDWLGDTSNINWPDAVSRMASVRSYNLSVQGGGEKTSYLISGGYYKQEGVILGSDYQRLNFRINTDNDLKPWLKVGNNLSLSHSLRNSVIEEGPGRTVLGRALRMNPMLPPYREDGSFSVSNNNPGGTRNPLRDVLQDKDLNKNLSIQGTVFAEVKILKNLKYKLNIGGSFSNGFSSAFFPAYGIVGDKWTNDLADSYRSMTRSVNMLAENILTYQQSFNLHNVILLGGYTAQTDRYDFINATVEGFIHPALEQLSSGQNIMSVNGGIEEWALLSQFGRLMYNFSEKYYLTATLRRDGSSRFGDEKQFGYFPSFSLKWRLSKEGFFPTWDNLSDLSIRFGYGKTGNQEISNYERYPKLNPVSYVTGNTLLQNVGLAANSLYNEALQWESAKMTNLGVDLVLFNNQLQLTSEYYKRGSENMLLPKPLPLTSGLPSIPNQNVGEISNEGVEFNGTYRKVWDNFNFSVNLNASYNQNKVINFGGALPLYGGSLADVGLGFSTLSMEGFPASSFYGFVADGIFQSASEVKTSPFQHKNTGPGDIKFKDLNDDGKIDDTDRTLIGNPWPKYTYGINLSAGYKGINMSVFLQGIQGNDIFFADRIFLEGMSGTDNQYVSVINRWSIDNTDAEIPRAISSDPNGNSRISTRFIEDGTYLRIKNVMLSYDIPRVISERMNIDYLQIYLTGTNLFTLTNFSGMDPEIGQSSTISAGIARSQYPVSRNFTVGAKLSF